LGKNFPKRPYNKEKKMAMYVVLYRVSSNDGKIWLKAKASAFNEKDLLQPVVGDRPWLCNTLLSTVRSVNEIPGGYEVVTENSHYKALLLTGEELESLVAEEGFVYDTMSDLGSLFYIKP
jgi:hypothetical protein